jgi:hypothetical protein
MSNGFFNKLGRALSIFGVSDPEDVRRMQNRKMPAKPVQPASTAVSEDASADAASQEKRTEDEYE